MSYEAPEEVEQAALQLSAALEVWLDKRVTDLGVDPRTFAQSHTLTAVGPVLNGVEFEMVVRLTPKVSEVT